MGQIPAKLALFGLSEPLLAAVVRPRLALELAEPRSGAWLPPVAPVRAQSWSYRRLVGPKRHFLADC